MIEHLIGFLFTHHFGELCFSFLDPTTSWVTICCWLGEPNKKVEEDEAMDEFECLDMFALLFLLIHP